MWTKTDFDNAYLFRPGRYPENKSQGFPDIEVGYTRFTLEKITDQYVAQYQQIIPAGSTVLIVGAGFGWTAEKLNDLGYTAVSLDTSPYVQAEKDNTDEAEWDAILTAQGHSDKSALVKGIVNPRKRSRDGVRGDDISKKNQRNNLKAIIGQDYDWLVTEEMISTLTDQEIITLIPYANDLATNFLHVTTVLQGSQDAGYNWKTGAEWRAFLDANGASNHQILTTGDWVVM